MNPLSFVLHHTEIIFIFQSDSKGKKMSQVNYTNQNATIEIEDRTVSHNFCCSFCNSLEKVRYAINCVNGVARDNNDPLYPNLIIRDSFLLFVIQFFSVCCILYGATIVFIAALGPPSSGQYYWLVPCLGSNFGGLLIPIFVFGYVSVLLVRCNFEKYWALLKGL